MPARVYIKPVGRWGRQPTYAARVGRFILKTVIVVKRVRLFTAGQHIQFAEFCHLSAGSAPKWRNGIISKLEFDRIFVDTL